MRLLADRCIGGTAIGGLRADGHDVLSLFEADLNPSDADVLALAKEESRVVLTEDADFGALVFAARAPSSGVIRIEQEAPASQLAAIRAVIAAYQPELEAGAFVTSRRGVIRVASPSPRA